MMKKKKLLKTKIKNYDNQVFVISAVAQDGITNLIDYLWKFLKA